ncbi:hypothetical protein L9F63_020837, partial [Diploptera punctata]
NDWRPNFREAKARIKKKQDKLMNFETPATFDLIQRFIGPPIEYRRKRMSSRSRFHH